MKKYQRFHTNFFTRYSCSSSRSEKILEGISNKMILIHHADHIQDLIWFIDTDWNNDRISSVQIVIFIFADDIASDHYMMRSSIFEYLSFFMVIIRFISRLYSRWNLVDYALTDTKEDRDPRSIYWVMLSLFQFFFEVIFLLFRFEYFFIWRIILHKNILIQRQQNLII